MVIVAFPPGEKYAVNYTTLDQYDYGQILRIQGLKLPKTVEVHFSTQETGGTSITRVGVTKDGVTDVLIPDSVLENGDTTQNYSIFAFVYITDATSGKTEYRAKLEVKARPKPEVPGGNDNPDVFRDAVLAVRESALKAEEDAKKTTEDRKAVEHAVESVKDITEQVARVEELSRNAQEAATQTQNAAQEIITDREQINTNKEGVAQLKEDLSELSEDIADIKQNGTGTGNGATTAQANSLWVIIQKSAFAQQLTDAEINEFKTTWGITEEVEPDTPTTYTITRNLTNCTSSSEVTSIDEGSAYTETITANNGYTLTGATVSVTMGDSNITSSYSNGVLNISSVTGNIVLTVSAVQETTEPDNPEVTLTSISATYTGGNVTVGTSVTDLTGITVTGTYSDGSTSTITGYTLSGEIVEGSNIITVSYGGKTTTFTVTGIAEEIEYTELSNSADSWEVGGIVPQGSAEINTARLRTIATLSDDVKKISVDDGYSYILVVYNEEQTEIPTNTNTTLFEGKGYYNPNGIAGSYNNDGFLTSQGNYFGGEMIISEVHANINSIPSGSLSGTAHFRILLKNNDNATLTADDGLHIHLWG